MSGAHWEDHGVHGRTRAGRAEHSERREACRCRMGVVGLYTASPRRDNLVLVVHVHDHIRRERAVTPTTIFHQLFHWSNEEPTGCAE